MDNFYFGGAANTLNLNQYSSDDVLINSASHDVLAFAGALGQDTITGFNSTDAVLTLDGDDKITFVGLQTSSVTA